MCVCVCVCVCECVRERERDKGRKREREKAVGICVQGKIISTYFVFLITLPTESSDEVR